MVSKLKKSTPINVYISASDNGEMAPLPEEAPLSSETQHGRILLMDDDELVRSLADDMVSALGHTMVCTKEGEEAIAAFS